MPSCRSAIILSRLYVKQWAFAPHKWLQFVSPPLIAEGPRRKFFIMKMQSRWLKSQQKNKP